MSRCPSLDMFPMVDRPLWQTLGFANSMTSNGPPESAPHLIAVLGDDLAEELGAEDPRFGAQLLPAFAKIRGHFPEPGTFVAEEFEPGTGCEGQDRIFVVEDVLESYEPRRQHGWMPVAPEETWTRHHFPGLGIAMSVPPSWQVEALDSGLRLDAPQWPERSMAVQVLQDAGSSRLDDQANADDSGYAWGDFYQSRDAAARFGENQGSIQGEIVGCQPWDDAGLECLELRIQAGDRIYTVRQPYGIGFEALPSQLEVADRILDTLSIDAWPTLTPTPAVHEQVGDGPFWDRAQAEQHALSMIGGVEGISGEDWSATEARLIPEAEALRLDRCNMNRSTDNDWYRYPEAVWLVELSAGPDIVYTTYLDAADGFHICTARRDGQAVGNAADEPYP